MIINCKQKRLAVGQLSVQPISHAGLQVSVESARETNREATATDVNWGVYLDSIG
jgi:hypothetical protein